MTNGIVVVLGQFGNNFGAGMSGGTAYLLDENGMFGKLHNPEMIKGLPLENAEDIKVVQSLIYKHLEKTDSARAREILDRWDHYRPLFVKVVPKIEPVPVPPEDEMPVEPAIADKATAAAD